MCVFNSSFLYLIIISFLLVFTSCEKETPTICNSTDGSVKEYNNWFVQDSNFQNKKEYKARFIKEYNNALNQKDYKKSCELLLSALQVMSMSGLYDEFYMNLLYDYLKKHESKNSIDDILPLYAYLGQYETFNNNYQKCIATLQKVTELEPYNYNTFTEKGHVYYYLSNSFYNLGEIDKALKENEKAIACFNRTDNYNGQALVMHHKASMSFDSWNELEAIDAIDKTIKIYKKTGDTDGLVTACINKYEFLVKTQPEKVYPYLDTISELIKKGKVESELILIHFNTLKFRKFVIEKNIAELDKLIPEIDAQVKKINLPYWYDEIDVFKSEYQVLKYKKIINKDRLLTILNTLKKNNDISFVSYVLSILREEAFANKNLEKVLEYSKEIEEYEKKFREENIQFKVKTFEKKIDAEKKEKIIAQQSTKLSKSYTYIFGLIGLLFLIVGSFWIISLRRKRKLDIIEQEKQEQFTFQLLQNTEDERNRIANELHDGINHELLNIKNKLVIAKNETSIDVEKAINEVRNISRNLYPVLFETIGLEASIENLCERLTESGLITTCEINYHQKLNNDKELQLYRIIQESLNNTLKHGNAIAAKVTLSSQENNLHLEIKDNGSGFNVKEQLQNPKSFGLQSILQRAKVVAAKINIDSTNKGTVISLKIPV